MADDAFFLPHEPARQGTGRFTATPHTAGPWDAAAEHGGPPSALLARAVELTSTRPDWVTARMAVEILGPVPVGELDLSAQVARGGRSVELVEAELAAGDRAVLRARAWRIRRAEPPLPAVGALPAPPLPDAAAETDWPGGYIAALEWRFAAGGFGDVGPATVWVRPRIPLVPDEPLSPLQRVMLVADSGNGVSGELDLTTFWFINPELTVHLHRLPEGDWICLDARTTIAAEGIGLAESVLYDRAGSIGRGAQALLVGPR